VSAAVVRAVAPAKLNLYLHVLGRRPDGYHELDSLVVFASVGDRLTAAPAPTLSLAGDGPFAAALPPAADNLAVRAVARLAERLGRPAGLALRLEKRLPVASGIGGGSADAAAALRAAAQLWQVPAGFDLAGLAAELGADVPVCLAGASAFMGGLGDRLAPAPGMPPLAAVLANPGAPLATAAVFGRFRGPYGGPARFVPDGSRDGLLQALRGRRNDLEATAVELLPAVGRVLAALAALPGARLARMSGSGPTCFALFDDLGAATRAAARLRAAEPDWWTVPCLLAAP